MPFCYNSGLTKVLQKLCLIIITSYLYVTLSAMFPTCPLTNAGWKIYPFDKQFVSSSLLFMTSAAITIVESNVWPQSMKPRSVPLTFLVELYIMTACIAVVYVVFWHPLVIATSMTTDKLAVQLNSWLVSPNVYKKSVPICMQSVRSTKFHCILLATVLLFGALCKYGKRDL